MSYQCTIEIPPVNGLPDQELTVGRDFLLVCEGEFPKDLALDKLHFVLEKNQKYAIQLRSLEFRSTTKADLKVVSYTAGEIRAPNLVLTDGAQNLDLGPIAFKVESVLPKPEPGQQQAKQEPFGPIGPAVLPVPPIYWILLAAVLSLAALIAGLKVYRVIQRRNMLEELREHDAALSPLAQYHQGFRKLQRQNQVFFGVADVPHEDILQCLNESYHMLRLYLTRRFQVPAMTWSPRLVLKDIRKYHPRMYAENGDDLAKLFKEYERAALDKAHLKSQEVLSIANHARALIERMERQS